MRSNPNIYYLYPPLGATVVTPDFYSMAVKYSNPNLPQGLPGSDKTVQNRLVYHITIPHDHSTSLDSTSLDSTSPFQITIQHHYFISPFHISIPHHHSISPFHITISHHHSTSPFHITISHHHSTSPFHITIPHHNYYVPPSPSIRNE